jgi:hypothetical protein
LATDGYCPTDLRSATIYGLSLRIQSNTVLNKLVA